MNPSSRLRVTLPPGWQARLESCANCAGLPVSQEASMLLCAGIRVAEKRWRQLGLFPADQCERCGNRDNPVAGYFEHDPPKGGANPIVRLCDDCARSVGRIPNHDLGVGPAQDGAQLGR